MTSDDDDDQEAYDVDGDVDDVGQPRSTTPDPTPPPSEESDDNETISDHPSLFARFDGPTCMNI